MFARTATHADSVFVTRKSRAVINRFAAFAVSGVARFARAFVRARTGHRTDRILRARGATTQTTVDRQTGFTITGESFTAAAFVFSRSGGTTFRVRIARIFQTCVNFVTRNTITLISAFTTTGIGARSGRFAVSMR